MDTVSDDLILNITNSKYYIVTKMGELIDDNFYNPKTKFMKCFNNIEPLFKYNYRHNVLNNKYIHLMKDLSIFLKLIDNNSEFNYDDLIFPSKDIYECDSSNDRDYTIQNSKTQFFDYLADNHDISPEEISKLLTQWISKMIAKITLKFSMYT